MRQPQFRLGGNKREANSGAEKVASWIEHDVQCSESRSSYRILTMERTATCSIPVR
jgi:hypothetical protein